MGDTYSEDDDLDQLFQELNQDREAADARVQSWQAAIKPGDYFRRATPYGFPIYGEILEEDEPREPRLQHFRLCEAYSVACPEGEMGEIHVSTIDAIISIQQFEVYKRRGWQP